MTPSAPSGPTATALSPDSGMPWTEAGAWQVTDRVFRIPLPLPMDGLRAVNVYVVVGDAGLAMIDGGWAIDIARDTLKRGLAEIGAGIGDVREFLVTHVHRDHYTMASVLSKETGATVALGAGDRPALEWADCGSGETPFLAALRVAGATRLASEWATMHVDHLDVPGGHYAPPTTWLEGDHDRVAGGRSLRAIHTPGHTAGHYVFADLAADLLFAGDHVLPTITPSLGFVHPPPDDPLGHFMTSLRKVRQLPDLSVLPAHGPVVPSSHDRVDELLTHHDRRLTQTLQVLDGEQTAAEVAHRISWTRRERRFTELSTFDRVVATLETKAHLDVLVAQGRAAVRQVDDADVFASFRPDASAG